MDIKQPQIGSNDTNWLLSQNSHCILLGILASVFCLVTYYYYPRAQPPLAQNMQIPTAKTTSEIRENYESCVSTVTDGKRVRHAAHTAPGASANLSAGVGATDAMALLRQNLDVDKVWQSASILFYGTVDQQIDAIALFSKVGTAQQKRTIAEYALDTSKELPVRLAAGENMDWELYPQEIATLITSDNEMNEAMVYEASEKKLTAETRDIINNAVYTVLSQTENPSTQIAVLHYFLEQHPEQFDIFATQITFNGYSPEEKEEVTRMLEQRKQDGGFADLDYQQ